MTALFTLSGATTHRADVDAWLVARPDGLRQIAQHWFAKMRASGPDVIELIHDGFPVACVQDAPFAYVNTFTGHVNAGFFHGADLPDPAGLMEGAGKRMRHVKLRPDAQRDGAALAALIAAAYADIRTRLNIEV